MLSNTELLKKLTRPKGKVSAILDISYVNRDAIFTDLFHKLIGK